MKYILSMFVIFLFSGCVIRFTKKSDLDKPVVYKEPSVKTIKKVDQFLDQSVQFVQESQENALKKGEALTPDEIVTAKEMGVQHPEKIRVLYVWHFSEPKDKALLKEYKALGFGSFFEGGRTNGYGIYIKSYFPFKKDILRHEFVHVAQFERMGLRKQVRQYLIQAMTYPYHQIPLEREAFRKSGSF